MDKRGNIYDAEMLSKLDPEYRRGLTAIGDDDAIALNGMNRKARRAWLAQRRRDLRKQAKNG